MISTHRQETQNIQKINYICDIRCSLKYTNRLQTRLRNILLSYLHEFMEINSFSVYKRIDQTVGIAILRTII